MVYYIMWPKTIDIAFRADYLSETGENVQVTPLESLDGASNLLGSSRVTQANVDSLLTIYPEIAVSQDAPPPSWIPKN